MATLQEQFDAYDRNWGTAALLQGKADADNIFKLHGLKVIRQIARYSTNGKDDYCYGKIARAQQILDEQKTLKFSHAKNL